MKIFKFLSTAAVLLVSPTLATSQCPAFGADTTCGWAITITDKGATVTQTGQGPYDGSDDTLVGVINNSSLPSTPSSVLGDKYLWFRRRWDRYLRRTP